MKRPRRPDPKTSLPRTLDHARLTGVTGGATAIEYGLVFATQAPRP
jgi:hypothetical protein